jgi:hypothetical protein
MVLENLRRLRKGIEIPAKDIQENMKRKLVSCSSCDGVPRETRERWPLLTVETKANKNSRSTYERGPSLVGSLGRHAGKIDYCPALTAAVSPVQKIIFRTANFFTVLVPITQQAGQ